MMMDFSNFDNYEKVFSQSKRDGSIPDQEGDVEVEDILTGKSQSGNPKYSWKLRFINGPYKGSVIYKNNVLSSPSSVAVFKRDLALCEFYPETLVEAFTNHTALIGCCVRVKQVTKNGFTSVYFQELISTPEAERNVIDHEGDGDELITV